MVCHYKNSKPGPQGSYVVIDQGKYMMMNEQPPAQNPDARLEQKVQVPARPNESGKLEIQDFVRIYDPNSEETVLEKRA